MVQIVFTVFGIIAVLCIPALWVAWNETVYYLVLVTFFSAVGVVVALSWMFREQFMRPMMSDMPDDPDEPPPSGAVVRDFNSNTRRKR